jgi:membrane protein implicated in regulation of membrane protease activity
MDDPDIWRWLWLGGAVVLGAGEILTTTFFLLPFALGALVAAVLAFLGVAVAVQLIVFAVVSVVAFAGMRPLARRLDRIPAERGVGANRLLGEVAVVTEPILAGDGGMIRVGGELWRAQSVDGAAVDLGSRVTIREVRGTRALVEAVPPPAQPHASDPVGPDPAATDPLD